MNVAVCIGGASLICQGRWLPPVERLANGFDDIEALLCERECGVFAEAERGTVRREPGRC